MTPLNYYGFVIDTNKYAGNFTDELCAHLTGRCRENSRAECYAIEELPINFDNIENIYGEWGSSPCEIYRTPQGIYNSVIIYFEDRPDDEQIAFMKERIKTFEWKDLKIMGFRLVQFKTEVIEEAL